MGWASGTQLFDNVIAIVLPRIDQTFRRHLFKDMLELFTDYDWDCINESRYWNDLDFQAAYQALWPDY